MSAGAEAAPAVPINATAGTGGALPSVAQPGPRTGDHQAAAIAHARAAQRAENAAPAANGASPTPAQATPAAGADKGDQKPAADAKPNDEKPKAKPDTVTQRIGDLTRQLRETREAFAAKEAELADIKGKLSAASTGAQKLAEVEKAFEDDPLKAFQMLGKGWKDIVVKVANGGREPTPEEVAAAERQRVEKERDDRLKALEDERKLERETREAAETEATLKQAYANIAEHLIKPDKHPHLVNIRAEAAEEAYQQVDAALKQAFKDGKRPSANLKSAEEALTLTTLALDGINEYYRDLATRISPQKAAEQTAATHAPATPAPSTEAAQQRRPISTITNAVAGGELPTAAQPARLSATDAQLKAMQAARRLPELP